MLDTPAAIHTQDDRVLLKDMLRRYAARYYLAGEDRDALVAQSITALAENPEVLLDRPIEKAIAETMHGLFLRNTGLR